MTRSLKEILQESISSVIEREQTALDQLLEKSRGRVVLFGAGSLGRRALAELRCIGVEPLCISDNNPKLWGTTLDGCPLLSPRDAAGKFGANALFVVTIWNAAHWFVETHAQLTELGCKSISCYSPVYWRFADTFLPFLLNDLPHHVYEDADNVLAAEGLWSDEPSQNTYRALVGWYASGDGSVLPGRPAENSYFPTDIFSLSEKEVLVDCGAFDGDTVRQLVDRVGSRFRTVHAIEADPLSLEKLNRELLRMGSTVRDKAQVHACAVGADRKTVRFETTGTVDSKICEAGGVEVECIPLDEMFRETLVSMIKMDIEGAEYEALLGASRVIQRDHPILAICVYHTQNDIWRIPLLVRDMVPEYKFFLRAYEGDGFQTVMYAVPPERVIPK
ncbi:MAG TPA: FkbM family methyltransferase [Terracidiphilus sp.]|nr:FkbM family methyltransferase [Terracidiphilus sp.]